MALTALTTTNLSSAIPEKWSGRIQDFFKDKLQIAESFDNWSDDVITGGDIIDVPVLVEGAASD